MTRFQYDLVVIGSGPAGESAAMAAVKLGWSVAVVDERRLVGGNCTHLGTIPSKSLRQSVRQIIKYNSMPLFRVIGEPRWFSFPQLMAPAQQVVQRQVEDRTRYYARNRVTLHVGRAEFASANEVTLATADNAREIVEGRYFLIATGSRPYLPSDVDFSHPCIFDSDSILGLQDTPRNIIIYGAGVIGCEYASIFAGLESRVDLINTRERMLSFLDDEISDALGYHLRESGVVVRHQEECARVMPHERGVTMELKSGKQVHAEALLWCNGRTGNTERLGLDKLGIEADHRGLLTVNRNYQTAVPHVYAAGDVIGWPSLAGAAYDQGRFAAAHMCQTADDGWVEDVAYGIYTIPEISCVGKTERELTSERIPYEVGRAYFKNIARAQISGEETGMLKILFHPESLAILGIHCFGAEATEILHIGQAIMNQEGPANTIGYFAHTTFNYPTMAEAYRVAAIAGLNRIGRSRRIGAV
ncbi:MAG: Si-specific NAD(P)(+) transhydrogenase [Porticoccaceae bacterium]